MASAHSQSSLVSASVSTIVLNAVWNLLLFIRVNDALLSLSDPSWLISGDGG